VGYQWASNTQDRALSKISYGGNQGNGNQGANVSPLLGGLTSPADPSPAPFGTPANWNGQLSFTYNAIHQLTQYQQNADQHNYRYDASGRLIEDRRNSGQVQGSYGYDQASNLQLLNDASGSSTFSHDADNIIVSQGGDHAQDWLTDEAGNTLEDASNRYGWDSASQLANVLNKRSGGYTQFERDALGRMIGSDDGSRSSTQKAYLWCDGYTPCARLNASGQIDALYYSQGEVAAAAPYNRYYARDQIGSIRAVMEANGRVIGRQDYSPYGSVIARSGITPSVGYAGMWQHTDSGLNLTWFRAYQPQAGRWVSRDPIEESGGINAYRYVKNRPQMAVDPSGLLSLSMYETWEDVSKFPSGAPSNAGGYTQGHIKNVNCDCISSSCGWQLSNCSGNLHVEVMISSRVWWKEDRFVRNAEGQHVADFQSNLEKIKRAGEQIENSLRGENFQSQSACELSAANDVTAGLQAATNSVALQSRSTYDDSGRHRWDFYYWFFPMP
jgi:RHS repeat-associated protein